VHLLYRVQRALHALGDRDELAWNVTGDGWHVPIRDAEATVTLPPGAVPGAGRAFTGPRGAAAPDGAHERQGRDLRFRAPRPLAAGEGFTIVVSWPPGAVAHPPAWRTAAWFFTDHWPLLLPLLALAAAGLVWRNFGRDPVLRRSVKPEYAPPPGLLPAEGGTLFDQRAEPHDVVATLVDLAVRGYLQIEAVPGAGHDFTVRRLAPLASDSRLAPLELAILSRVFGEGLSLRERRLSELRRDAQYVFAPISDAIYRAMVADRLFPASPFWIRQAWLVAGIAVLFVGGGLLVESTRSGAVGWSLGVGVGACGLVLVGLSRVMPRRTLRGARLLAHLRGFREFLERAEKDRLERLPADTLHRWMPWAIALGVGRMWIGRFGAIGVEPPAWYTGRDAFTLQGYEEALADFGRAATEALVSAGAGSAVAAVAGLAGRAAGGGAGGGGGATF
jgi:hypothetical protein